MYSEGIHPEKMTCPFCGVPLNTRAFNHRQHHNTCNVCKNEIAIERKQAQVKLVTVYIPRNESEHLAAQALLKSAGIEYFSKNFTVQGLFGAGQIGTGFNIVTGPIQIQVTDGYAFEARELLRDYFSAPAAVFEYSERDLQEEDQASAQKAVDRLSTRSMLFCIFWFGGIGASIAIYYALRALHLINESEERLTGSTRSLIALAVASLEVVISPYIWMEILSKLQLI